MRATRNGRHVAATLTVLVCVPLSAWADDGVTGKCANLGTTDTIQGCETSELETAQQDLDDTYEQILARFSQQKSIRQEIVRSQESWMRYRDSDCRVPDALNEQGMVKTSRGNACRIELTRQRDARLKIYLDDLAATD